MLMDRMISSEPPAGAVSMTYRAILAEPDAELLITVCLVKWLGQ